jgi:hypothetical protein
MTERTSTYLDHARAHADQPRGRFTKQMATKVVGVPEYPPQPATSHWASDPVPPEPPLGFRVDEVFHDAPSSNSGEVAPTVSPLSVEPTSPTFLKRRV